jgi:pectinesterase
MKSGFTILSLLLLSIALQAQRRDGITGTRDTSYNLQKEFAKQQKNYPDIRFPEIDSSGIVFKRNVFYCHTPERELSLDIAYPEKNVKKKRTAILFIHGGGWRSGSKSMHEDLLKRLAASGYVCISPEYRLSTEALYPAAIHDVKSAIRWIRQHAKDYNINPDQIVVAGHSAGGELAAMMGATNGNAAFEGTGCFPEQSSKANAVIDLDGTLAFIHPESGEGDDSKKTSAATYWFGFSKNENPGLWIDASPLTHAGPHCPPILFINSSVARMHAGREDYIRIMDSCGIYSSVKSFDNSPHGFCFFEPWFSPMAGYMDAFIKEQFTSKRK